MDNFEKRMFLDYLDKTLEDINLDSYKFDKIFEEFLSSFNISRKKFKMNDYNTICLDTRNDYRNFKTTIIQEIKKQKKKFKTQETKLEKKFLILKNIFYLDETKYKILILYILKELNPTVGMLNDCLSDDISDIYTKKIKINEKFKSKIVFNLHKIGLLVLEDYTYTINPKILEIFLDENCNSKEKIVKNLIGKKEKSKLRATNFKHLKNDLEKTIKIIKSSIENKEKGINILLYGSVGCGKTEFAKLIANQAKIDIYKVATENDYFKEASRTYRLSNLRLLQNTLSVSGNSCILLDEAEDIMNKDFSYFDSAPKGYLNKILEENKVPIIWTTNNIFDVDSAFLRRMTYAIEFKKPNEQTKLDIWKAILNRNNFKLKTKKIQELAKNYNVSPSIIENAIKTTKMIGGNENDIEDLINNIGKIVSKEESFKNKEKNYKCQNYSIDLMNTDINMKNLTEKIKKSGKKNFSLCLYGESGTGKSQYAKFLAKELNIKIVYKRASDLKSKWAGETEKNIADAFLEAKEKRAMLIFDEADSFLQDRKNANANWEISQVNEMLTNMESHEYPFICTTNLINSLDEACLRRFTFKIKFNFLNKTQSKNAMELFFNKKANIDITGLSIGDFATVKKKIEFLETENEKEIIDMLKNEVKMKKSENIKRAIGF